MISYCGSFITLAPGPNDMNNFTVVIYKCLDKQECLSMASLSSLVLCLRLRPELARVEHLNDAPLYGRLLVLPTNIRLGW